MLKLEFPTVEMFVRTSENLISINKTTVSRMSKHLLRSISVLFRSLNLHDKERLIKFMAECIVLANAMCGL